VPCRPRPTWWMLGAMTGERAEAPGKPPDEETIKVDEERADTLRQIAEVEEGLPHCRPAVAEHRALARVYTEEAEFLRSRVARLRAATERRDPS
jgi:hypothetical protein